MKNTKKRWLEIYAKVSYSEPNAFSGKHGGALHLPVSPLLFEMEMWKMEIASEKREKRRKATTVRSQLHLSVLFPGKHIRIRHFQNSRFTKEI